MGLAERAEELLKRMDRIVDQAHTEGRNFLLAGEKALFRSLETQVRTITKSLNREQMALEGEVIRQELQLTDLREANGDLMAFRRFVAGGDQLNGLRGQVMSRIKGTQQLTVELRQQAEGTGSTGGYLTAGWTSYLLQAMQAADGVGAQATVITGDKRLPVRVPMVDDLSNTGFEVAENQTITAGPDAVFSAADTTGKTKYSSGVLAASYEAAEDAGMADALVNLAGKRLGRRLAIKYAAELAASAVATTTSETSVRGKLSDAIGQCPYALADVLGVGFAMHPKLLSYLQKKEVAGLLTLEAVGNRQFRLLGFPVFTSPYLPSTSDSPSSTIVYFGAFSRLQIVLNTVQIATYKERYAEYGEMGWQVFVVGGQPKLAKCSAGDAPVVSVSLP